MFRELLALIGKRAAARVHPPYGDLTINTIYNLLFCDDPALYKAHFAGKPTGVWEILFSESPSIEALVQIGSTEQEESRVRALAFNLLKAKGQAVPSRKLLGVIVEVALPGGLDVLAVYQDHSIRYINQTGKLLVWEVPDLTIDGQAQELLSASQNVIMKIGPWDKPRLPPPSRGIARMTFVVSDGLYLGHGPITQLQRDPIGGRVIASASALLATLVEKATK